LEPHPGRELRHALLEGRELLEPGRCGAVAARRLHAAHRPDPLADREAVVGPRSPRPVPARDDLRAGLHGRALRRRHPARLGVHADRILGREPLLRPPRRAPRTRRRGRGYLTEKPDKPSGSSSKTSTRSTWACGGPSSANERSRATASGSPSNTASTVPSAVLCAHPATPCCSASRRSESRKKTPCTRPPITTLRLTGP